MKTFIAAAILKALAESRSYNHKVYVDLNADCAQVKFEGFSGIEGTLDLYQPHRGQTLVYGSFKNLQRD